MKPAKGKKKKTWEEKLEELAEEDEPSALDKAIKKRADKAKKKKGAQFNP